VLWRALCRPYRADDVCPAYDTDNLALSHDRHALDPLRLQQRRDVAKVHVLGDSHDIACHEVLHRTAMRFDVFAREVGGEMVEPPRTPALTVATRGADFGTVQQVALTDDADQTSTRIDDWGAADAAFRKQRR
jgi:hypothetical protein